MKNLLITASIFIFSIPTFGQIQFGTWRTPSGNTDYHHFTRSGGGATVYVNQVSSDPAHHILRLSSGTETPNQNVRFTVENNGFTGINLIDPKSPLAIKSGINGTSYYNGLSIWSSSNISNIRASIAATSADNGQLNLYDSNTNADVILRANGDSFLNGGKFGIGITNPSHFLQIVSNNHNDIFSLRRSHTEYGNTFDFRITGNPNGGGGINNRSLTIMANQYAADIAFLTDPTVDKPQFAIKKDGTVTIGTTTTGSHKLAVEGSIGAREIKVEANGWSDFVFEKDYDLRTLEEVEQHINENGHLPEMPSEAEVTENGINLGEMDAKLLQKIEELTLYMIDMNKQVQQLKSENQELKEKINNLENE